MSKIYEALKHARRERKGFEKPEFPSSPIPPFPHPPIPPSSHPIPPLSHRPFGLEMEEEMARLYQGIDSLLPGSTKKVIQFIGSREGEGTSTVVREFARASATKFGKSVLLLDADRYKPTQHLFFNIKPEYGWMEVIRNNRPLDKALYKIGNTDLFISPISSRSSSTPWIFNSHRFDVFWEKLRQLFDLILVDSPPALRSQDSMIIFPKVDGVVLVVEAERTRWQVAESVKDRIVKNGGRILGVVLNKRQYYIPEFIYKQL